MGDNFDAIHWEELHDAEGKATTLPELIFALRSTNFSVANEAYDNLVDRIFYQEVIYQATSYAIPYLIDILLSSITLEKTKFAILILLTNISEIALLDLKRQTNSPVEDTSTPKSKHDYGMKCYHALQKGVSTYIFLLASDNAGLRGHSALLLGNLHTEEMRIARILVESINIEKDQSVQLQMIDSLSRIIQKMGDVSIEEKRTFVSFIYSLYYGKSINSTRLLLAFFTVQADPSVPFPDTIELIKEALISPIGFFDKKSSELPVSSTALITTIAEMNDKDASQQLGTILVKTTDAEIAHEVAKTWLDIVFGRGILDQWKKASSRTKSGRTFKYWRANGKQSAGQNSPTLNVEQKQTIERILENDLFWTIESNLLNIFGLPADRSSLRSYLANT